MDKKKPKCPNCKGTGYILKFEHTDLYKRQQCHEVEMAYTCDVCQGKGTVEIPFEENNDDKNSDNA